MAYFEQIQYFCVNRSSNFAATLKLNQNEESIIIDGSVTNTDFGQFSFSHMKESLYFNGQVQVNRFGLNRFSTLKNEDNYVTASIFASGTLEHPYVALSVDKFSMLFASDFLKANGSAVLDDGFVKINDFNMNYSSIDINDISFKPIVSIVVPVYNVPIEYLKECVDSVINQTYPYWPDQDSAWPD